jgi:hypothetical protein
MGSVAGIFGLRREFLGLGFVLREGWGVEVLLIGLRLGLLEGVWGVMIRGWGAERAVVA